MSVWRSAEHFEGARHLSELARIAVIVWVLALTVA
jgi:hypothetical protein